VVRQSQVMDALQFAASVDNIDESHAGGFDDLLFELCQSRARRESIVRGEIDASRQWLQTFSYVDPTVPSQELDELDRAYKFFNEEGLARKGRIPFCRCTPPRPARECNYLSWKKTCSEIKVQIQVGQKLLEKGEAEKALQWGHKVRFLLLYICQLLHCILSYHALFLYVYVYFILFIRLFNVKYLLILYVIGFR